MSKRCKCFWAKSRTDENSTRSWFRKQDEWWLKDGIAGQESVWGGQAMAWCVYHCWRSEQIVRRGLHARISESWPCKFDYNWALEAVATALVMAILSYAAWRQIAELDMFSIASQAEYGMQIVKWYWEWLKSRHSAQQKTSFHPFFGDCLFLTPDLASEFYGRPCFLKPSPIMSQ